MRLCGGGFKVSWIRDFADEKKTSVKYFRKVMEDGFENKISRRISILLNLYSIKFPTFIMTVDIFITNGIYF